MLSPLIMFVKKVQITCCEDAHKCIKKQACSGKSRFIVWFEASFWSTMHPFNVGSGAQVHTLIKYTQKQNVFICEFINVMKAIKTELHRLYVDPFFKYDDSAFNKFNVFCEHYNELLPSLGFHMSLMLICTCCHTWHLALLATTTNSITLEVLMVFMFMWIWMTSLQWLN
jgi:hypothetical protein